MKGRPRVRQESSNAPETIRSSYITHNKGDAEHRLVCQRNRSSLKDKSQRKRAIRLPYRRFVQSLQKKKHSRRRLKQVAGHLSRDTWHKAHVARVSTRDIEIAFHRLWREVHMSSRAGFLALTDGFWRCGAAACKGRLPISALAQNLPGLLFLLVARCASGTVAP